MLDGDGFRLLSRSRSSRESGPAAQHSLDASFSFNGPPNRTREWEKAACDVWEGDPGEWSTQDRSRNMGIWGKGAEFEATGRDGRGGSGRVLTDKPQNCRRNWSDSGLAGEAGQASQCAMWRASYGAGPAHQGWPVYWRRMDANAERGAMSSPPIHPGSIFQRRGTPLDAPWRESRPDAARYDERILLDSTAQFDRFLMGLCWPFLLTCLCSLHRKARPRHGPYFDMRWLGGRGLRGRSRVCGPPVPTGV